MKQMSESTVLDFWRIEDIRRSVRWVNPQHVVCFEDDEELSETYWIELSNNTGFHCKHEQLDQHMRCDYEVTVSLDDIDDESPEPSWWDCFKQLVEDYHATDDQAKQDDIVKEVFDMGILGRDIEWLFSEDLDAPHVDSHLPDYEDDDEHQPPPPDCDEIPF